MWRFLWAGLLIVGGLIALAAVDDVFFWTPVKTSPPQFVAPPVITPAAPPLAPLPAPQYVPPVPPAHPEVPPVATVQPEVPPVVPPVPVVAPPPKKNRPVRVLPSEETSNTAVTDLATARDMLNDGQIAEARHLLTKVQFRMVLTKVTPDQPNRDDTNIAASRIGDAIRQLDRGDTDGAKRTISQVLTNGF